MFAEVGRQPQNPGPLIRVPAGTRIRVSVRNALGDSTLVVYGLSTRPSGLADTMQIAPGATRERTFEAGVPGTYFYWGSTTHQPMDTRNGMDSQLHGAFIVDSAGVTPPTDRIFVLGSWTGLPVDTNSFAADLRVINGLSWPHTEQLAYTAGDTIRWRWVNPTDSPHPMHLHGFYFDVTHRGSWSADTAFAKANVPRVVTELPLPGGTFAMTWVPEEPGNWLVHCHVSYHTSMWLAATVPPGPPDPVIVDHAHGMRGMVLAVSVRPGASAARRVTGGGRSTGHPTRREGGAEAIRRRAGRDGVRTPGRRRRAGGRLGPGSELASGAPAERARAHNDRESASRGDRRALARDRSARVQRRRACLERERRPRGAGDCAG